MDPQTLDPNHFAVIVYDDGAKVDGLMTSFACELVEAGVDPQGIVQLPPDGGGFGPGVLMKLCDVAGRQRHAGAALLRGRHDADVGQAFAAPGSEPLHRQPRRAP